MRRARGLLVALSLSSLLFARVAAAQNEVDVAARSDLLRQAQAAREAGRHDEALDLAGRAGRIEMTVSVRRFLAEEYLAVGRLAEALGSAQLCVRDGEREPASRGHDAMLAACRSLVEQVGPRVGRVTVRVPTPPPTGLHVTVNGAPLSDVYWGIGYIVTPGIVTVEASAPGYQTFTSRIEVNATAPASVDVALVPGSGPGVRPTGAPVVGAQPVAAGAPVGTVPVAAAPVIGAQPVAAGAPVAGAAPYTAGAPVEGAAPGTMYVAAPPAGAGVMIGQPANPEPRPRRSVGGIVMTSVGGGVIVIGLVALAFGGWIGTIVCTVVGLGVGIPGVVLLARRPRSNATAHAMLMYETNPALGLPAPMTGVGIAF
jgi:hypothetical protein